MRERAQARHRARRTRWPGARSTPVAALAALGLLSGCGGGASHQAARVTVSSDVKAQLDAAHRQVTAALHHVSTEPYGGIPAFIPKAGPVDRIVTATAAHHVLASQGSTVALRLAGGRALVTAVGRQVPRAVIGTDATTTKARFDVRLESVRGTIRTAASWFTITDQLGHVHRPSVRLVQGGPAPPRLVAGHPVTLRVRSVLPEGTGLLRYGPTSTRSLIGWDFTVETD